MNAEALQSICLQIEQERADLLVLGGDLVDEHTSREEMKELFEMLSQVTTQYGIYYIYGNHDRNAYTKHPNYTAKAVSYTHLITECCFVDYQEWLAPLLIQASPNPLLIALRN